MVIQPWTIEICIPQRALAMWSSFDSLGRTLALSTFLPCCTSKHQGYQIKDKMLSDLYLVDLIL